MIMKRILRPLFLLAFTSIIVYSCGSTAIISTPIANIDNTPTKFNDLTEAEEKAWGHLDLIKDTIPGMSINKAYDEIIKSRKGKTVVVAVIDAGIDTKHEDLKNVMWVNKKEVPNNGKDDDNNGFVDDIHGWNFLGNTYDEQFEYVRLLTSGDTDNPRYNEAQEKYSEEFQKYSTMKVQYEAILKQVTESHNAVAKHLNKEDYTKEEVNEIKTTDQALMRNVSVIKQTYGFGIGSITETIDALNKDLNAVIKPHTNFYLNKELKGRKTGDDPNDFSQIGYGNGNVNPAVKDESHGTHVAGIIAAERNNGIGMNGVANNVQIMSLRVVPNGDEYDKDVALAIRYAVDNGAKVINASFGKYYSPHDDKVEEALAYASQNDVLFVHGAGNESLNLDKKENFPNDNDKTGNEFIDTFLSVGATTQKYGADIIATYSNYGIKNVDVFAPGSNIYSTYPESEYSPQNGTSMAAPAVTGIAALIRSYYPKLSAAQVKQIIMDSGLPLKAKVIVPGGSTQAKPFADLSKSGKLVNAYNALILANTVSKN